MMTKLEESILPVGNGSGSGLAYRCCVRSNPLVGQMKSLLSLGVGRLGSPSNGSIGIFVLPPIFKSPNRSTRLA